MANKGLVVVVGSEPLDNYRTKMMNYPELKMKRKSWLLLLKE